MKKALIIIGTIIGLFIIVSFLLPKTAHVERSITIKAPIDVVFNQVNDLMNWESWSPWLAKDPEVKLVYSDIPVGQGAWYTWAGNDEVKSGKLTILESNDNASIKTQLEFEGMGDGNNGTWSFEETEEGVKVTWGFDGDMSQPIIIGRYFGLMMDGMLGPDFEKGLENIKSICENMESETSDMASTVDIEIVDLAGTDVVTITETTSQAKVGELLAQLYAELKAYIEENGGTMNGAPFAVYHQWSEEGVKLEAGFPIVKAIQGSDRFVVKKMNATKAAKATHMGDYSNIDAVHRNINVYVAENGYTRTGAPWEVYLTDPMNVTDTAKWTTEVYYPIGE